MTPVSSQGEGVGAGRAAGRPQSNAIVRIRLIDKYPRLSATLVLWLASCAFVAVFSRFARWEADAHSSSIADLCRWDCNWFSSVLEQGYDTKPWRETGDQANWLFHPVLPLAAYPLNRWLGYSPAKSLVLTSKAAFFLCIYAFLLMASDEIMDTTDYIFAGSLVAFNPYLIYGHAGYSEPLYFAFLSLAFYFAQRGRWIAAGAMGALVSGARMVGFVFSVPYTLFALRPLRDRSYRRESLSKIIGLLLCPLGTALYMLYLYRHTGDALAQVHIHIAWVDAPPTNPLAILWRCLRTPHWPRLWGMMCIGTLGAAFYLFKLKKPEYAVYLLVAVLLSLAGGVYGMARYLWWQPPLLYAIYCWLRRHPGWWSPYLALTSGLAAFMVVEWFSGHNFVV